MSDAQQYIGTGSTDNVEGSSGDYTTTQDADEVTTSVCLLVFNKIIKICVITACIIMTVLSAICLGGRNSSGLGRSLTLALAVFAQFLDFFFF